MKIYLYGLLTLLGLNLGCKKISTTEEGKSKTNVIVVMTDDQGYPDLGCNGHPDIKSPNMDKLAISGARLMDFHVNPFCSPTRAALLTGRMSDRTGVTSTNTHMNYMRRNEVLMSEYFKASGYATGIFGKWHVGANYPFRPIDRGFDEWFGLGNNGLATSNDLWDNDRMDDRYWHNGEVVKRDGFCTDVYFDEAMRFMRQCKQGGQSFFTYLATNVPHWDWNVPESWLEPYLDDHSLERAAFYASINRIDWNIGRLMSFLKEETLLSNTILVFLTDNGSDVPDKHNDQIDTYTANMKGFKGSLYEGGHRVPCFIVGPQNLIGKPKEIEAFAAHVDLLPTFIDLCELKMPDRDLLPLDGRSLKPLLTGNGNWDDRMLIMHHQNGRVPEMWLNTVVMTSEWRLIQREDKPKELYNIKNDPTQESNVIENHPEVVSRLSTAYETHWNSLGLTEPLPRPVLSDMATIRLTPDITNSKNRNTQQAVRKGTPINPNWLLSASESSEYLIEVRRWPREVGVAMNKGIPAASDSKIEYIGHAGYRVDVEGVPLDIMTVELHLSDREVLKKEISGDEQKVEFTVRIPKGDIDLEAWFVLADGTKQGAYFVYIDQI